MTKLNTAAIILFTTILLAAPDNAVRAQPSNQQVKETLANTAIDRARFLISVPPPVLSRRRSAPALETFYGRLGLCNRVRIAVGHGMAVGHDSAHLLRRVGLPSGDPSAGPGIRSLAGLALVVFYLHALSVRSAARLGSWAGWQPL